MRHTSTLLCALLLTCGSLLAQPMSGSYSIGPGGQYTSFQAAANDLNTRGVSAAVVFLIAPGPYTESFTLDHVPGASNVNTVTFRSIVPRLAKLTGASGATLTFPIGTAAAPVSWYIFDGIEFTGGPGHAVMGNQYNTDIVFRNCEFLPNHVSRLINVNGNNQAQRWTFHHCKFTMIPNADGIYGSQISFWEFHHNEIDLNGCRRGVYTINLNNAQNKWYNNIIYGNLANGATNAALSFPASNYENHVFHNTLVVNTNTGNALYSQGWTSGINRFHDNVVVVIGGGTCIRVFHATGASANLGMYTADNNVYFAPGGNIGFYDVAYPTLPAWRTGVAAMNAAGDTNSVDANPMLASMVAPYDLRLTAASLAAIDKARYTPAYITDDFEGNPRGANPDIGAYEFQGAGFVTYGLGCPGSGQQVPAIGYTGTPAIGSSNFNVTAGNALGGAPGLLIFGVNNTAWLGLPLPLDIGGRCNVYQAVLLAFGYALTGTGPGGGAASAPIPIPNDPTLGGAVLYLQWLIVDPAAPNALGVVTTQGGQLTL